MHLYTDSCGPSLDHGVQARLRRLDKDLRVTFSRFTIDPSTSRPLRITGSDLSSRYQYERRGDTVYLVEPAWHLWVKDPDGRYHHVTSYGAKQGFGHREIWKLERDVARFHRPHELGRILRNREAARRERLEQRRQEKHADFLKANKSRIQDHFFGDTPGGGRHRPSRFRQARVASYAGQKSRRTPGEMERSDAEQGWESLPRD